MPAVTASLHRDALHFVAHGMGLVGPRGAAPIGLGRHVPLSAERLGLPAGTRHGAFNRDGDF